MIRYPGPQTQITEEDLKTGQYRELKHNDPLFWEKCRYYTDYSRWEGDEYVSSFRYYEKVGEVYGLPELGSGYMYILACTNQPGILKIGCTERKPVDRLKEINSATGVIVPWILIEAFPCRVPRSIEKLVHEKLDEYRLDPRKEGFNVTAGFARDIILQTILENHAEIQ